MICKNDICCPVCRALCCVFNESDTCMKFTPGEAPGYDCPVFLCRKEDEYLQDKIKKFNRIVFTKEPEADAFPSFFVRCSEYL